MVHLGIKKKSKVPGVMITQFMEELPEGKTTPDFTRKPIALTIQEGKIFLSANMNCVFRLPGKEQNGWGQVI